MGSLQEMLTALPGAEKPKLSPCVIAPPPETGQDEYDASRPHAFPPAAMSTAGLMARMEPEAKRILVTKCLS